MLIVTRRLFTSRCLSTIASESFARKPPKTLVLNADYTPISITSAARSIALCVNKRATAIKMSDQYLKSELMNFQCPSIIVLSNYVKLAQRGSAETLLSSRTGILRRDRYTCQYCGDYANTVDHVKPRCRGGLHTWDNLVAACSRCNTKKGSKELSQTTMKLQQQPRQPSLYDVNRSKIATRFERVKAWETYLQPA